MADLTPGETIADRYYVDRLIGVGGMGSVYEAHDRSTGQRVAIKVLHTALQRHPVIPKRFVQEAMAARSLTTPFAVKVEGTGTLADGCPFIVMEYLDGADLGTLATQAGGTLSVERVVRLADQIAAALEEAHARGIVHRDLKPDNIFVINSPHGEMVKVVDFGISKILTREDGIRLTQTGTTLGTPQYMPMEQLRGAKDLDGRVDVYAIGVVLYEVLAGTRPYDGFTYEEVILKVATTTPPSLSTYRTDLPPSLVDLVGRAMERDRDARIGSMTELRQMLAGLGFEAVGPTSYGRPPVRSSSNHPVVGDRSSMSSVRPAKRSSPLLPLLVILVLIGGAVLLFAVGSAGAWFFLQSEEQPGQYTGPLKAEPSGVTSTKTGAQGR